MAAMDLRTNQEVMGMQSRYTTEYGSHMFTGKETFEEADIKGNNNIFNSLKTEANSNHSHDPSSLYQVKCSNKRKLEVDNSLFSYSSFKKAMDLRTHNRTLEGGKRTIFDDAEYFAKTHCYKLLPITFEQVDETIIQSEHNYSLFSLTSESEAEEDCSRMMDYSQIKEKNYKRRRSKFREGSEQEELFESGTVDGDGNYVAHSSFIFSEEERTEPLSVSLGLEPETLAAVQPLDLSGPPLAKDEKTDLSLRERSDNSAEKKDKIARLDSDKENVDLQLSGIRVTITRPDEKENYQPCDLFLNDIARLVPWLIDKDCFEVDIMDRTCDGHHEFRKNRLYYVISEPTWRLFQTSNERVILTNDQSLGPPIRKAEKGERPSFLVFDQFSLAKCLAEYCQEIGGCFEYTCVEEGKEEEPPKEAKQEEAVQEVEVAGEVIEIGETSEEMKGPVKILDEGKEIDKPVEPKSEKIDGELQKTTEEEQKITEEASDEIQSKAIEHSEAEKEESATQSPEEEMVSNPGPEEVEEERNPVPLQVQQAANSGNGKKKEEKKQGKETKLKTTPPIQPEPKNCRMTTRSKSTSESETSQKSDERVSRRKRGGFVAKVEPPPKLKKPQSSEAPPRQTRSGKVLEEVKGNRAAAAAGRGGAGSTAARQRRQSARGAAEREVRSLRSQSKDGLRGKGRTTAPSKSRSGKR